MVSRGQETFLSSNHTQKRCAYCAESGHASTLGVVGGDNAHFPLYEHSNLVSSALLLISRPFRAPWPLGETPIIITPHGRQAAL